MIAPGRWADLVLVQDLNKFAADLVIAKGRVVAENGISKVKAPTFKYPLWAEKSVHLKRPLKPGDFALKTAARNLPHKGKRDRSDRESSADAPLDDGGTS